MNIRARRYRERSYCMVKVCILHIHRVHVMVHSEFEYIAVFKRVSRSTNSSGMAGTHVPRRQPWILSRLLSSSTCDSTCGAAASSERLTLNVSDGLPCIRLFSSPLKSVVNCQLSDCSLLPFSVDVPLSGVTGFNPKIELVPGPGSTATAVTRTSDQFC